jgi:CRISPR-associated protein Cas1
MEKVKHTTNLLQELSSYYDTIDYDSVAKDIAARTKDYWAARKKNKKPDPKRLMLYESHIAILYWNCLSTIFRQLAPQFNFPCRGNQTSSNNMNASDEINAMLNYGYAVLESWVRKYICAVGLDQSIGFLHHMRMSNTPLVYDLLELYRWMVDLSVLQLLEDRKLKKSDFVVTEHYHTRLREQTAELLIGKLQLNLNRRVPYKNKQFMYDGVLQDNVQILANHIQNKADVLQFCIPPVKISRNDTIDMRETILRMTPEERKKLGINKSTLWYMQKNLLDGKRVKIYRKIRRKMGVSD